MLSLTFKQTMQWITVLLIVFISYAHASTVPNQSIAKDLSSTKQVNFSSINPPLKSETLINLTALQTDSIIIGTGFGILLLSLLIAVGVYALSKRHRQLLLIAYIAFVMTSYLMSHTELYSNLLLVSSLYFPIQLLALISVQIYILTSIKSIQLKRGFIGEHGIAISVLLLILLVSALIPPPFSSVTFSIIIIAIVIFSAILLFRTIALSNQAHCIYLVAWILISLQGVHSALLALELISGHFINETLMLINVVVLISTVLIADRQKVRQYHHNLTHDDDTGLPNKQLLLKRSEQLMRAKQEHSLILFRPSILSSARANFGYDYANACIFIIMAKLTEQLAAMKVLVLEQSSQDKSLIARLDESSFAFIVPTKLELSHIEQFTCIIDAVFSQGITHDTTQLIGNLEIGVAHSPLHANTPTQLVQCALQALNVKSAQGQRWHMFDSENAHKVKQRMKIAAELKTAIEKDQLSLYFQPQLYLTDAKVYGAEALLRWNHPELGHVPPDLFIPIAESSGMISELTEWVVTHALAFQREIIKLYPEHILSINISAKDLSRKELPVLFITLLSEYELLASSIMLELTESATLDEGINIKTALQDYRLIGVKIAIDDFGTGYSSLATLSQIGFDEIKIDKQFVMNLEYSKKDQTICQATCDIAKSLDSQVIAEGIEGEQALQALLSYGCEIGQGYYFSRPLAFSDYMLWLSDYLNNIPTLGAVSNLNGKSNH